jgi:hypothetical protein
MVCFIITIFDLSACKLRIVVLSLAFLFVLAIPDLVQSNNLNKTTIEEVIIDEVFFDFRFRQFVNTTLIAYYIDGNVFFPIGEILGHLLVFSEFDSSNDVVRGYISSDMNSFQLDFRNNRYRFRDKRGELTADDYYIDVFDTYLIAEKWEEIFGFQFDIDFSLLTVRLITEERLPIQVRFDRFIARNRMQDFLGQRTFHEPLIDRNPQLFNGGFLDYSLNYSTQNFDNHNTTLNLQAGTEVLFGDFQGSLTLSGNPQTGYSANWGNARWRYYLRTDSNLLPSQYLAGNIQNRGIVFNQRLRGATVTNEPLYQSRIFDEFNFTDNAQPDSEVEVFINDRLFDYFFIDESGFYSIRLPITFGINDIRIVKYSPDGQIVEINRRLNIPFYFVPNQKFYYTAYIGRSSTSGFEPNQYTVGLIDAGYGLSRSITVRAKAETIHGLDRQETAFQTELNNRINRVITSLQYSPNRYESLALTYQSEQNSFLNLSASNFRPEYQRLNNDIKYRLAATGFVGLSNVGIPLFLRSGYEISEYTSFTSTTYSGNITARLSRISLNAGFRSNERQSGVFTSTVTNYNASLSYSTPRQGIWRPLTGLFLRSQIIYINDFDRPDQINFSMSRRLFQGQLQASYNYFFATNRGGVFLSVNFEIPTNRFNTSFRTSGNNYVINQNIRGSLGYFHQDRMMVFDNRNQVGRSAVIFNSFLDTDGDGVYTEADQRLRSNAIRMQGSGARSRIVRDKMVITGLRPYDRYNVEINDAMITDPTLVGLKDKFSIITDPNQFKYVEVPFSRSGIVDGSVTRRFLESVQPVSGLNIRIMKLADSTITTARSFFDGSFFAMGVIPGQYIAYPDSAQLQILGVRAEPAIYPFEIVASEFGDFVDIAFELYPLVPVMPAPVIAPEPAPPVVAPPVAVADPVVGPPAIETDVSQLYRVQIAMMPTMARAMIARQNVETLLNHPVEITMSPRLNMYRVLTRDVETLQEAERMLSVVRARTEHRDAYTLNSVNYRLTDIEYAVQIGAFRNSGDAEQHAREARERFGLDVISFYHEISGWFVVQTREFTHWNDAIRMRDRIRATTTYTDAFTTSKPPEYRIFANYSVQVGAYSRIDFARQQAESFSRRTGMNFEVVFNEAARLYTVRLVEVPSLQQAEQLLRRLLDEFGFEEGMILSLETAVR